MRELTPRAERGRRNARRAHPSIDFATSPSVLGRTRPLPPLPLRMDYGCRDFFRLAARALTTLGTLLRLLPLILRRLFGFVFLRSIDLQGYYYEREACRDPPIVSFFSSVSGPHFKGRLVRVGK